MAEIKIRFKKRSQERGSIRIRKFSKNLAPAVRKGIRDAASILELQIKLNLSGPSHTLNPGSSNPFPGTLGGDLKQSVSAAFSDGGFTALIGPGGLASAYAGAQEFGTDTIPDRPYVKPAFEANVDKINRLFELQVFGNL